MPKLKMFGTTAAASALALTAHMAQADQVFSDDLIVLGSICAGLDCSNGESFGFDTLRLKENNLRIKFDDTSTSASFPSNDWQLTANDSGNGGANKFSIDDITGGRTPFTIEASAPSHSLFVDDGGRIGIGTSTPVVQLQVVDGNSPTLRLEQDGSSGFTPQIWDVAGNETNFFIRDTTNSSQLPFRIRPGADQNLLYLDGTNRIGVRTASPDEEMHVIGKMRVEDSDSATISTFDPTIHARATDGTASLVVEEASGSAAGRTLLTLTNNGSPRISMVNTANGADWRIQQSAGNMQVTLVGSGNTEMALDQSGNLTISGDINSGGTTVVPDYVFEPDYELMPLEEVESFIIANKHLPKIPSAAEVGKNGLNMTEMQMALLEKVEELTLYTLEQQARIDAMQDEIDSLNAD